VRRGARRSARDAAGAQPRARLHELRDELRRGVEGRVAGVVEGHARSKLRVAEARDARAQHRGEVRQHGPEREQRVLRVGGGDARVAEVVQEKLPSRV